MGGKKWNTLTNISSINDEVESKLKEQSKTESKVKYTFLIESYS